MRSCLLQVRVLEERHGHHSSRGTHDAAKHVRVPRTHAHTLTTQEHRDTNTETAHTSPTHLSHPPTITHARTHHARNDTHNHTIHIFTYVIQSGKGGAISNQHARRKNEMRDAKDTQTLHKHTPTLLVFQTPTPHVAPHLRTQICRPLFCKLVHNTCIYICI